MTRTEECHSCGGNARDVSDAVTLQIGSRSTSVEAERMRCDSCGVEFFLPGQMEAAQRLASTRMREQEGLLAPEEVKAIRATYGLKQTELEAILGVGPKTVVRWERGTVFQNNATDALLRVLREMPAAMHFLARQRGISVEPFSAAEEAANDSPPPTAVGTFAFDIGSGAAPYDDPSVIDLNDYKKNKKIPLDPLKRAQL